MDARVVDNDAASAQSQFAQEKPAIDLHRHIALFRRRIRLMLAIMAGVFVLFMTIVLLLPPTYTAMASVELDPRQANVVSIQQVLPGMPADTTQVDTEAKVLQSRALAEKVVDKLKLTEDDEFNTLLRPKSFIGSLVPDFLKSHKTVTPEAAREKVVDNVLAKLKVARDNLTLIINVSFSSDSADKSARIANAFADQYLLEQLDTKFDATRRASDWLNSRLAGLRSQVETAESAVEQYRASHGLLALSEQQGTITQQEISNLNTQLAQARAEQAGAEAKLNTAKSQLAAGSHGDDLGEALSSPVVTQLRQQRAQVSAQVADLAGRYGPRHPDMLKAQRQLADIDSQIQSEITRVTSNLEAQVQVARQRTNSLAGSVGSSKGSLASSNAASVKLAELQRNADAVKTLYQAFLDRFKQTTEQQGIQQSDSHVVARATTPTQPSFPKPLLMGAVGVVFAGVCGLLTIFIMEALEQGLYTTEDVEKTLRLPHLGSIPDSRALVEGKRGQAKLSPLAYVIDQPLSSFAEAFRHLATSIQFSRVGEPVHVVAVTSALPGEGKTTTTICLARVMAAQGTSVVVVDCDLRRRTVNRLLSVDPAVGLLEYLAGNATLDEVLVRDEKSGAYLLPLTKNEYTPKDLFASAAFDRLLEELRRRFTTVLLDTAPVLPVDDTRVLAPKADCVVFLARWRKTPRKAVEHALHQLEMVGAYVAGVGLTQVNMRDQVRYGYGDASYYYRSYSHYYSSAY